MFAIKSVSCSSVYIANSFFESTSLTLDEKTSIDPTQNLTFSLSLTAPQEIARSQVVLPYMHGGEWVTGMVDIWSKPCVCQPVATQAAPAIYYDPDSADDIDDDDPHEL